MTKDEEDRIRPDLLTAWEAAEPPARFADRVMNSMAKRDAPRGWPTRRLAGLMVLVAAAAVVLLRVRTADPGSSGAARVAERQSLALGRRGVAVAEAGAELEWRVQPGGDARIVQKSGDVFYRVERGGRFVVVTAAGEVEVTGTCFRVEVDPMSFSKQAMWSAGLGRMPTGRWRSRRVSTARPRQVPLPSAGLPRKRWRPQPSPRLRPTASLAKSCFGAIRRSEPSWPSFALGCARSSLRRGRLVVRRT